ncbi:AIPR family protein [Actinotalea sp. Marseille-Q4924]|uniref:AIPR family protein n=1 Tax=Actinotalea sp. Marseille-Q4924 TaxID=2866571 RepID=UPI001CE484DB|nr:AIPR family protein [Actinotalea sp. Marseille-Q4924]
MYDLVAELATLDEAGGLAKERSVLLLWFLRNVVGVDDLDAYEYICDGDDDYGVDGLFLEAAAGDGPETLVVYQSKYTEGPTNAGPNSLHGLISAASHFSTVENLESLLAGRIEPRLRRLVAEFDLIRKLRAGAIRDGKLRIRIALVTTGVLNAQAKRLVGSTNGDRWSGYLTVYDLGRLGPLAQAVATPTITTSDIVAPCKSSERVVIGESPNRVVIAAVRATDIVKWDGIETRALFELNVRREVRRNRVRDQLDRAIRRPHEHKDFLAYHNGMTVVCESLDLKRGSLVARKPSVVNGAQSTIAFDRAAADGELTEELRVFVKFVEVARRPQLQKEISWRSNTQTAVNARNLVALGGPQQRLVTEFGESFPDITYETRPDATLSQSSGYVIKNDDAAQLLCAVFNAMPWLAVKRLALFESENHAMIFNERITAAHVVLADQIKRAVEAGKDRVPAVYRKSWQLSRMVMVYLVGEVLRSDERLRALLESPGAHVSDVGELEDRLKLPVRIAAATLKQRSDQKERASAPDEFNVEFKRQDVLLDLRDKARDNFSLAATLDD